MILHKKQVTTQDSVYTLKILTYAVATDVTTSQESSVESVYKVAITTCGVYGRRYPYNISHSGCECVLAASCNCNLNQHTDSKLIIVHWSEYHVSECGLAASDDMSPTQLDPWSFTFANVITLSKPTVQSEPFYRPLYKNLTSSYSNSFVGGLRIDIRGAITYWGAKVIGRLGSKRSSLWSVHYCQLTSLLYFVIL